VGRHRIWIRKNTPDLKVAVSCLVDGEFDDVRRYLDQSWPGVIVDAGGYIGTSALALTDLFPKAKVLVIEPSSENLEVLRLNVSAEPRIEVVAGALVGSPDTLVTVKNRGTGPWGHTIVERPRDSADAPTVNEAQAFRLHELVAQPETIGLLKLDIEGGEFDLFVNDSENIRKVPLIFVELHDRIVDGCSDAFHSFSAGRQTVASSGEKFFSIDSR
jgi:FkbM family methyltransferase